MRLQPVTYVFVQKILRTQDRKMAYTTVEKPSAHFDIKLHQGSSSTTTISGVGFKPDMILTINRGEDNVNRNIVDSSRGNTKNLFANLTDAETTATRVASFTSDGFTLTGDILDTNKNGDGHVNYMWKFNGGTTSSNSDGSITSTVQVNSTTKCSIVTYTGTGSNATVGHGLGVAPKLILIKRRNDTENWQVYWGDDYQGIDETDYLELTNSGTISDSAARYNDTAPTTSVFSIGTHTSVNNSSDTYIAYCFAETTGFMAMGAMFGNGNNTGPFCYCGFKPRFVVFKAVIDDNQHWNIMDSERQRTDYDGTALNFAKKNQVGSMAGQTTPGSINLSSIHQEGGSRQMHFTSTGFYVRQPYADQNADGIRFIWFAFADMPTVGTNGTVATAF